MTFIRILYHSVYSKTKFKHQRFMKQLYMLAAALIFSISCFAQVKGASKLYGYKQEVMPGTIRVDENGNQVRSKTIYNYFIYLASTTKVTPTEIWVNGKAFSVNVTAVEKTPVEFRGASTEKPKTLVPKTTRKVLQLSPTMTELNKAGKGKTLSANNELVIIYKGNGKTYYKTLAKLPMLEAAMMQ